MGKMEVHPIGRIEEDENGTRIVLEPAYGPALRGLQGYSHVQVVWWFDRTEGTSGLIERKSYAKGPDELGAFATRSPCVPTRSPCPTSTSPTWMRRGRWSVSTTSTRTPAVPYWT